MITLDGHEIKIRDGIERVRGDEFGIRVILRCFCHNENCDVRQVRIKVKGFQKTVREVRCPSCRLRLTVTAVTEARGSATTIQGEVR